MTENDEHQSLAKIESCRRVNHLAATKFAEHGASLEDIAIASIYTALDLATMLKGSPIAAVEWLRTAINIQERDVKASGGTIQ